MGFLNFFKKIKGIIDSEEDVLESKIVTRIAPSPTGNLHVGTARTALFNYLFAKKHNGKFLLRLEDTDKERSTKEFEENVLDGLKWLGIDWDNTEMFRQSERTDLYKKYLEKMIKDGKAFISKEELKEGKEGRSEVIRFKNPNKKISFQDIIRGEITFDTEELGDFVIAKSLDEPLFHLAVVVDDFEMKVTHVIRGEDHISNTQRQILIQEAIGASRPVYAHLPLLLGKDKSKLSKRHGAISISTYREQGYLPEALINYLALLGWNPGTEQELFIIEELIKSFDLDKVQKGGAIFDTEKLDWFNREHLKKLPKETLEAQISHELEATIKQEKLEKIVPLIMDRIAKLSDVKEIVSSELSFVFIAPQYEAEKLLWKNAENLDDAKTHLTFIKEKFEEIDKDDFNHDIIKQSIWDYASEKGRGDVLWPLRYALSGQDKSPDPFEIADILGKKDTLSRINTAIDKIG